MDSVVNDMNRKIFPEKSSSLPVVGIIHSRRTHMTDSDELDNMNDEADLLSNSDTDTGTLTARSEIDRKLLVGTNGGSSSNSSSYAVKTEFEDFYRIIPSLTHSGLAISNARKEKILKCNKDPFEQQGIRTRIQAADGGTTTAVISGSYVICSSSSSSSDSESAGCERIKLFDGIRSDEESSSDLPGHWIELRTINSNRTG